MNGVGYFLVLLTFLAAVAPQEIGNTAAGVVHAYREALERLENGG